MRRSALALWTAKNMLKVYIARYELPPPSDSLRCLRIFNHKERVMKSVVEEIQEDIHYLLVCLCRHAPETEALATYTPTPSEAFRAIHRRIAFVENIAPATAVVPLGAKAEASSTGTCKGAHQVTLHGLLPLLRVHTTGGTSTSSPFLLRGHMAVLLLLSTTSTASTKPDRRLWVVLLLRISFYTSFRTYGNSSWRTSLCQGAGCFWPT
jgi:hypothetical protein